MPNELYTPEIEARLIEQLKQNTLEILDFSRFHAPAKMLKSLEGHSREVTCVAVLSNGQIVSGSNDKTLKVWNPETGQCLQTLEGHTSSVLCVAPLIDQLVSGGLDHTLRVWDPESGQCLQTLMGHSSSVRGVAVLPNGQVVSASPDKTLKIWNPKTGECLQTHKHSSSVWCVTALNGQVVSGDGSGTLWVWNPETAECLHTLSKHSHYVSCVVVLPNGHVVSGSGDSYDLLVWNLQSGKYFKIYNNGTTTSLAALPNGHLVTHNSSNFLLVWDLQTRQRLQTISGHTAAVSAVAVLPNGQVVSGSDDKTLKVWDANPSLSYRDVASVLEAVGAPGNTLRELSLKNVQLSNAGFEYVLNLIQTHSHLEHVALADTGLTSEKAIILQKTILEVRNKTGRLMAVDILSNLSFDDLTLHDLARYGWVEELQKRLLLESGLLEQRDATGETPLLIAVRLGFVVVVDVLLRYGACLEVKTSLGETPLDLAFAQNHQELLNYFNHHQFAFARDTDGNTALHRAVAQGQRQDVENLIDAGAYVNAQNKEDQTPLHVAVRHASNAVSLHIAQCLIQAGADMTLANEKGFMPLWTLNTPRAYQELATLLMKHRNRLSLPRLNNALAIARLRYKGDFAHREADRKLLDQAFQFLTGKVNYSNISALMNNYLLVYLGHLISLKGNYERVSHAQKGQFELFSQDCFLALRGRLLFEALIRIEKGFMTGYPCSKKTVITALKQELLLLLEALQGFLARQFIWDEFGDKQADWAFEAVARNVSQHIRALQPNEHYVHCAGYYGHAFYVTFEKRASLQGQLIYRLDNLGGGSELHDDKQTNYKRKPGQGRKCLPFAINLPESHVAPDAPQPALKLIHLLQGRYKPGVETLPLLYAVAPKEKRLKKLQLEQDYPWRRDQGSGESGINNCVVKNYQVGIQIRLRAFLPEDSEQPDTLYRWWREEEPKLLPIKSYLVQASIAVGYGSLKLEGGAVSSMIIDTSNPRADDIILDETLERAQDIMQAAEKKSLMDFYLAVLTNDHEQTRALIIQEARKNDYTDLHFAILANDRKHVNALLQQKNINIGEITKDGYHAIHLAVVYQRLDLLRDLLKHATRTLSPEALQVLLNTPTDQGDTLLHLITRQSETDIQDTLAVLDACDVLETLNPSTQNQHGETPQDSLLELNLVEALDHPAEKKEQRLHDENEQLKIELQQEQKKRKQEQKQREQLQNNVRILRQDRSILHQDNQELSSELQKERKQREETEARLTLGKKTAFQLHFFSELKYKHQELDLRAQNKKLVTELQEERKDGKKLTTELEKERQQRETVTTELEKERKQRKALEKQLQTLSTPFTKLQSASNHSAYKGGGYTPKLYKNSNPQLSSKKSSEDFSKKS